jgi:hypothetical protein
MCELVIPFTHSSFDLARVFRRLQINCKEKNINFCVFWAETAGRLNPKINVDIRSAYPHKPLLPFNLKTDKEKSS